MASHWAFVIGVLPGLVILIDTYRMSSMISAFELLLMRFQWLSADTAFWIVSSN